MPPPSSQFQAPGDDFTPQELHNYLQSILSNVLVPGAIIKPNERADFVILLRDLFCIMMGEFPQADASEWNLLKDRVKIIEVSLEILHRTLLRVEGIFGGDEKLENVILAQFLVFGGTLETWIVAEKHDTAESIGPRELKGRLRSVAVDMLMALADIRNKPQGDSDKKVRCWEALRSCLEECLGIVTDLSATTFLRPIHLTFFGSPRLRDDPHDDADSVKRTTIIHNATSFDTLIADSLYLLVHGTSPLITQAIMSDLIKRGTEVVCFYFSELLAARAILSRRTASLAHLLEAIKPWLSLDVLETPSMPFYLYRLLVKRLQDGPQIIWDEVDKQLLAALDSVPAGTMLGIENAWFKDILENRAWDDEAEGKLRDMVYRCLHISIPRLHMECICILQTSLSTKPPCDRLELLLEAIRQSVPPSTASGQNTPSSPSRRAQIRSTVIDWFFSDPVENGQTLVWIDEDDLDDTAWCGRIMEAVNQRLSVSLLDSPPALRILITKRLIRLPCLLSHGPASPCLRATITPGVSFIPTFMTLVGCLLDGLEREITPELRLNAYEILRQAVRHHSQGFGGSKLESVLNLIKRGMARRERSVRLRAGRALAELVPIYQFTGRGSLHRLEPLFRVIGNPLSGNNLGVLETTLITAGLVGRIAQGDTLGRVVHLIIAQLGHQNPVIKGLAYMQLLDLTRHHDKGPYTLLSPYLPQISVYVISALCTNPELFLQTCSFLDMTASKFYNLTISHFLPHLVCACNGDALNKVARELRKSPVSLVTTHDVLAHVFLLDGIGQTEKVFKFILQLLLQTKSESSEEVTVLMLVKSNVVPLLGEIVICMGDEDPKRVGQAISAVQKVEQVLAPDRRHRASTLLVDYVMGIVSHLNEVLQDAHGKRPLAVKKKVMRSLGALVHQVGSQITTVAPQIMATMQSMLLIGPLTDETLSSWHTFITTLAFKDIGPYVGPTSAAFVAAWPELSHQGRELAMQALRYLIFDNAEAIGENLNEIVRLDDIPELALYSARLDNLRAAWSPSRQLENLLDRVTSDNLTVAELSLSELRRFMQANQQPILKLASGDVFDPLIGKIVTSLWATACRDGEGMETLRLLAFDCIGRLGAMDPDRLELATNDSSMILYQNFGDEEESIRFALYLITDVLLGTFRSTSDIKFQSHLAFAIQELLKFCGFTEELVSAQSSSAIPLKIRSRWTSLPRHVLEACTPLLEAKYTPTSRLVREVPHPIYPSKATYREWMQDWTAHLIDRVLDRRAKAIFDVFRPVVVDKDVGVARYLLPHLVLHILISGNDMDAKHVQSEIVAVLEDQVHPAAGSSSDRRLLSAQTVFMLMDHLNKWVRAVRQDLVNRRADTRKTRGSNPLSDSEHHVAKVDSVLSSVDHDLMAKAAFECKAYARSLMNFERQILTREARGASRDGIQLQTYYDRLHEIYAHLDEPDGMEGITTRVLAPSLEHQIRQHESTGRWTSAQSCWEVRLQKSPDELEFHLGLLRCLRNLGHYDTLRTHIKGILSRNPSWNHALSGFQAEGAWMVSDWQNVQELAGHIITNPPPEITVARVLLAMREGDPDAVSNALSVARAQLGAPIHAAGRNSYRRAYDSVLNLHLVHDVELIYETIVAQRAQPGTKRSVNAVNALSENLSRRFEATLPSFRTREPVLSLQRTALGLGQHDSLGAVVGRAWLSTAKIARKAGHAQTAYSAVLQAQRADAPFSFIQSAKLVKTSGDPLRALQELNKALEKTKTSTSGAVIDLTGDADSELIKMNAKAQVLRAQWMYDADRFDIDIIHQGFKDAVSLAQDWESAHFHLGRFYDQRCSPKGDIVYQTIKSYIRTLQTGSKYVYQTMPRMLTLWLDLGEKEVTVRKSGGQQTDLVQTLVRVNAKINSAVRTIATYKWLTAFPQIVSRVDHSNKAVYELLSSLLVRVLEEYPRQGLWLFMSVVQSKKTERNRRGSQILNKLTSNPSNASKSVSTLANQCRAMTTQLLKLCNHAVTEEPKAPLSMAKLFPGLASLTPSQLIVPLQESLIALLPSESSLEASHQPFPHHLPTIQKFDDAVEVMKSLAKPRKITIRADNGKTFAFLGKPKDDLRKDARLMDFNAMINKLLKTNSDSRRRQLHIRTYSVITLNEESGLIQWVPNTTPMRPVLIRSYELRGVTTWGNKHIQAFAKIKELPTDNGVDVFTQEILPMFPPVFHEWFVDTFPEPSAWLASRLSYARTAAVMSMVGFILGLGDRHSENILLDVNTGDVIHVDFDCLFEKGKKLETPERVPFRLTQNMRDGLGVTDVDGPFRIACEVTMSLLRRNKECLMSVLDAFIHDPLVEWEDEKKKMEKQLRVHSTSRKGQANTLKDEVDLRSLAKNALLPIQKKLEGIYVSDEGRDDRKAEKEMTTSNLVDTLIQEATSYKNLARMYPGWGAYF